MSHPLPTPPSSFFNWLEKEPSISGVIAIGSRVKDPQAIGFADEHSDWDYQVITKKPELFNKSDWTTQASLPPLINYSVEQTFGDVPKVAVQCEGGLELDLVLLAPQPLQFARLATWLGLHRKVPSIKAKLGFLSIIIAPGYQIIKGQRTWGALYQRTAAEVPIPRIDDEQCRKLCHNFDANAAWATGKIPRGELRAVQRMLHHELVETNLKLLHELKLRRREPSFPEARRLELVCTPEELEWVTVSVLLTPEDLAQGIATLTAGNQTLRQKLGI